MRRAIIVFTRVPVAGQTKTRLMPYFSPQECAGLHTCFLKDIAGQCQKTQADLYICYTPDDKGAALKNMIAASEYDESLKDDCDILADIENLISDVAHNLSAYMDDFTFDQYNRNYIV